MTDSTTYKNKPYLNKDQTVKVMQTLLEPDREPRLNRRQIGRMMKVSQMTPYFWASGKNRAPLTLILLLTDAERGGLGLS